MLTRLRLLLVIGWTEILLYLSRSHIGLLSVCSSSGSAGLDFDKPIDAKIDLKSAINKINVNERNLELWPDNQYRDLAYMIKDMFFGERQGLSNGFYVYANEKLYLKPGKMWRRKD